MANLEFCPLRMGFVEKTRFQKMVRSDLQIFVELMHVV